MTTTNVNKILSYVTKEYDLNEIVKNNEFLLLSFNGFDEAKQWVTDNFPDTNKRWATQYSKADMCVYLSHIEESVKNYTASDIISIIDNRKIKQFKEINPRWFQFLKADMDEEQSNFMVDNAVAKQYCFWPKLFMKKLTVNSLMKLEQKLEKSDGNMYTLYKLIPNKPTKIFALVNNGPVKDNLAIQINYLKKIAKKDKEVNFDFNDKKLLSRGLTGKEISQYFSMSSTSFYNMRQEPEKGDRTYSKFLRDIKEKRREGLYVYFDIWSLEKGLRERYQPAFALGKDRTVSRYMPSTGYYRWQDLVKMYGVKHMPMESITIAMANGKLGYLKITEDSINAHGNKADGQIYRYTKQDFEDFLMLRQTKSDRVIKKDPKEYIYIRSDDDRIRFNEEYLSQDELYSIIPLVASGVSSLENTAMLKTSKSIMLDLPYVVLVEDLEEKREFSRYYSLKDVAEAVQSRYGYTKILQSNKKDKLVSIEKVKIDVNKDTHFIYANVAVNKIVEENPEINKAYLSVIVNKGIRDGLIPVLYVSQNIRLVIYEILIENPLVKNYLESKRNS